MPAARYRLVNLRQSRGGPPAPGRSGRRARRRQAAARRSRHAAQCRSVFTRYALPLLGLLLAAEGGAAEPRRTGLISIIIDDLGYRLVDGRRALSLPGPVSYAILPHTPFTERFAAGAVDRGRDVLIHIPMEARRSSAKLGPGALLSSMSEAQYVRALHSSFLAIPQAMGINNHMGSLLTEQERPMRWLMETLQCHGRLVFIDSRTTPRTVAARLAGRYQIPFLSRDVFLDHTVDQAAVQVQFQRLLDRARKQGTAIAIGHPKPATLDVLERMLPRLEYHGVRLVSLSELLDVRQAANRLASSASIGK